MKLKNDIKTTWQEYKRLCWDTDKFFIAALVVFISLMLFFSWVSNSVWEKRYQESGCAAYENLPTAFVPARCIEWFD